MKALTRLGLSPVLALALGACAEPADTPDLAQHEGQISGGVVDSTSTGVVGIAIQTRWGMGICSGSLIAPNLVLTAQHCVAPTPEGNVVCGSATFGAKYRANSFYVTTETTLPNSGSGYHLVDEVIVPLVGGDICGDDLALLVLSRNVNGGEARPHIPRIDVQVGDGELFDAVGYGQTENGTGSGTRRIITDREILCHGDECGLGDQMASSEWLADDGTCQGDSGGPAIDSIGRVLGALSRGGEGCIYPVYTGLIAHADWLRDQGQRAADLGGYEAHYWITTGHSEVFVDHDRDNVSDDRDNCPNVANPDQADGDRDGLGDLCDEEDGRDLGGRCAVCQICRQHADCPGGGICVDIDGSGGVCTFDCSESRCPATTACSMIEVNSGVQRAICVAPGANIRGACPDDFICGGDRDELPEDACRVCDICANDGDCGVGGVCADFGAGKLCTYRCDDAACPGDSVCADVNGEQICVSPEGADDVCPPTYRCEGGGAVEPKPIDCDEVEDPATCGDAGAGGAGGEGGEGGESGEGGAPAVEADGGIQRVGGDTEMSSDGCQASPGRTAPGAFGLLFIAVAGLGLRRRRRR